MSVMSNYVCSSKIWFKYHKNVFGDYILYDDMFLGINERAQVLHAENNRFNKDNAEVVYQ